MTEHTDKTTVAQVGDIILIGEEHRNSRCRFLAETVLDDVTPGVIALEHRSQMGAIGALQEYARSYAVPAVKIDGPKRFRQTVDSVIDLLDTANHFEYPIQEDGDLDPRAPRVARKMVRDEFGLDTHREMYPERERYMARRLNRLAEDYDGPVVAGVGAFHVEAIVEMLPRVGAMESISPSRVKEYAGAGTRAEATA